jgi:hypothetical protein
VTTALSPYLGGPMQHRVKMSNQWRRWVQEGIADALVFRGHRYTLETPEVVEDIEEATSEVRENGFPVYAWYTLWDKEATEEKCRRTVEHLRKSSLAGCTFHEAAALYYKTRPFMSDRGLYHYWELLMAMKN